MSSVFHCKHCCADELPHAVTLRERNADTGFDTEPFSGFINEAEILA